MSPISPRHPCNYPGCDTLVEYGRSRCERHKKQERKELEAARPSAAERGYGAGWRRSRKRYLADHPLCVQCLRLGRLTSATVVDHVVPHKGDDSLFWDDSNWAAMCRTCHDRKTARSDGRWG